MKPTAEEPSALSDEELVLVEARAEAKARIDKERRKKLFDAAMEEEIARLRAEDEAINPPAEPAKRYRVTLSLPENVAPVGALFINSRPYYDRASYDVDESTARQLMSMQAEAWKNQGRIEGKFTDFRRHNPVLVNSGGAASSAFPLALVA